MGIHPATRNLHCGFSNVINSFLSTGMSFEELSLVRLFFKNCICRWHHQKKIKDFRFPPILWTKHQFEAAGVRFIGHTRGGDSSKECFVGDEGSREMASIIGCLTFEGGRSVSRMEDNNGHDTTAVA